MEQTIPILILELEGVLQSWGEHAKWDWRDTAAMPTKSGVIGLFGCALGLKRDDPRLAELSEQLAIAVRADRAGVLMTDFHTVKSVCLLNAEHRPRQNGGTIITHRGYLQDAFFTVAVTGERALLEELAQALRTPRWAVYLGRRNCVPARPVLAGITEAYGSLLEALHERPLTERADEEKKVMIELDSVGGEGYLRADAVANGQRQFLYRRVVKKQLQEEEQSREK